MSLMINTNVGSMNAQRQLGRTNSALSKTLGRLASGLRINGASDDAAGLAISQRLSSQVRGLNQAQRNANDGISLLQTAESALNESTDIVQRMRELAVQSANDTNTADDRAALQQEVDQLKEEMDRIATTTQFNGSNVLDGSFATGATFQVGANAGQTISVAIQSATTTDMGQIVNATSTDSGGVDANAITTADQMNGQSLKASTSYGTDGRSADSAYSKARAVNASNVGVTAQAQAASLTVTQGATLIENSDSLAINGQTIVSNAAADMDEDDVLAAVNVFSAETGVVASKDGSGDLVLTAADGRNIDITVTDGGGGGATMSTAVTRADVKLTSTDNVTMSASLDDKLGFSGTNTLTVDAKSIQDVDISTQSGAAEAIDRLDSALQALSTQRAGMGAVQNRLDTTIQNLANVSENLSAARSRVLDADFAAETAALSKHQILQQSGVAALSQANSSSQIALSLLR